MVTMYVFIVFIGSLVVYCICKPEICKVGNKNTRMLWGTGHIAIPSSAGE